MSSHMPYDSIRYKAIQQLQERMEADAAKEGLPKYKLLVKGEVLPSLVYRFPSDKLFFNKANGRIKSEVLALESQLGRKLDPSSEEDQAAIKTILLGIRPDENHKIKEDLGKNGQMQPGIITCDGVVINGNRRKALLEKLYDDTHDEAYRYLDVHVLPSNITRREVWLIEAGIQLSTPQQLDYGPINYLLKLREGFKSGISAADMASGVYGMNEEKVLEDLERLGHMDEYLDAYLQQREKYYLVEGKNEHFIDLQNILKWLRRPRGRVHKDWDPDESDISELKLVAFHYIRAQFPHLQIRTLRDTFNVRASWEELHKSIAVPVETELEGEESSSAEPAAEDDEFEDENAEPGSPLITTTREEEDLRNEKRWRQQNIKILKENFESGREQLQIQKDSVAPLALARRAYRNLDGIRSDSEGFDDPKLDNVLGDIIRRVNELRRYYQKRRAPRKKKQNTKTTRQTSTTQRSRKSATKRKKKR